jgi:glutamyl-tRNA synthetase
VLLLQLLGALPPEYVHVPLVVGADGDRLAKRHGAVTIADLRTDGWTATDVVGAMARSLHLAGPGEVVSLDVLLARFDVDLLPRAVTTLDDLIVGPAGGWAPLS